MRHEFTEEEYQRALEIIARYRNEPVQLSLPGLQMEDDRREPTRLHRQYHRGTGVDVSAEAGGQHGVDQAERPGTHAAFQDILPVDQAAMGLSGKIHRNDPRRARAGNEDQAAQ